MDRVDTYQVLGVHVQAVTMVDLLVGMARAIEDRRTIIVANQNLHSVYLYHRDPKMRSFYARAAYTHIDGMPLVYLGRLLGHPLGRRHRVAYIDWIPSLCAEAVRNGWRMFYLGSRPGIAERGAEILRRRFEGLQMVTSHGYFDARRGSTENRAVLDRIKAFEPHILLVGMGMPRQEHWIVDNLDHLRANVVLNSGAAIDYVAGVIPTPPRWMGQAGLEWFFRLVCEPRRLWRRYLLEPWCLGGLLVRDLAARRLRRT